MPKLVVADRCDMRNLPRRLKASDTNGITEIDLRNLSFIDPWGLVSIAVLADRAVTNKEAVQLQGPSLRNKANYLSRMGMGDLLEDMSIDHDLPSVTPKSLPDTLLELQRFETGEPNALADMLYTLVEPISLRAAEALSLGISEAGENVFEHSARPHGYMAAQRWRESGTLAFAVGDSGVGLLSKLAPMGASSHIDALHKAMVKNVTSSPKTNGGKGLASIRREVFGMRGYLRLASGTHSMHQAPDSATIYQHGSLWPGTILQGLVRLDD